MVENRLHFANVCGLAFFFLKVSVNNVYQSVVQAIARLLVSDIDLMWCVYTTEKFAKKSMEAIMKV